MGLTQLRKPVLNISRHSAVNSTPIPHSPCNPIRTNQTRNSHRGSLQIRLFLDSFRRNQCEFRLFWNWEISDFGVEFWSQTGCELNGAQPPHRPHWNHPVQTPLIASETCLSSRMNSEHLTVKQTLNDPTTSSIHYLLILSRQYVTRPTFTICLILIKLLNA